MLWKKGNRLRLVPEPQAEGRTREIYGEIKVALGVPHVSLIFQCYAAFPPFLELHWSRVRPVVEAQEFFSLAERLRADAYTRMHNYFDVPDLRPQVEGLATLPEVTNVIDLFLYLNPILLLIGAAQLQAFEGTVGQPGQGTTPASHPVFPDAPLLIDQAAASAPIRKLYEDYKRATGMPFVGTTVRALARWPRFLAVYWDALKSVLQSPMYQECFHGVRDSAWALTRELPRPFELTLDQLTENGLKDEDLASLVRITELFVKSFSGLMLNISLAKIGLEGGTRKPPVVEPATTGGEPQRVA